MDSDVHEKSSVNSTNKAMTKEMPDRTDELVTLYNKGTVMNHYLTFVQILNSITMGVSGLGLTLSYPFNSV